MDGIEYITCLLIKALRGPGGIADEYPSALSVPCTSHREISAPRRGGEQNESDYPNLVWPQIGQTAQYLLGELPAPTRGGKPLGLASAAQVSGWQS